MIEIKAKKTHPETKTCKYCGETKKLNKDNFRYKPTTDSYVHKCKVCTKKVDDKHNEEYKEKITHPETRICTECGKEKLLNIDNFYYKCKINRFEHKCKICRKEVEKIYIDNNREKRKEYSKEYYKNNGEKVREKQREYHKEYYKNNKEKRKEYKKEYRKDNKEKIKNKNKEYNNNNKDKIKIRTKQYRENNKEKCKEYSKEYKNKNSDKIKEKNKEYRKNNREKINKSNREYNKKRIKNEPGFKLTRRVSHAIWSDLRREGYYKNDKSCSDFFLYSKEELREHISSQFEDWMTWDNQGVYRVKTWDDNDPTTWTWQVDHIIPKSDLPYSSPEDENFKICWSFENLRPYSAKQNILDGANRIRHKKAA